MTEEIKQSKCPEDEKCYHVVEKDTDLISGGWKACHILALTSALVFSFLAHYETIAVSDAFGRNCVLYAAASFSNGSIAEAYQPVGNFSGTALLHRGRTSWGDKRYCNYCSFAFLFSGNVGIILLAFFVIVRKGGRGYYYDIYIKPWRIVVPAIIISVAILSALSIAYAFVKSGFDNFCSSFQDVSNTTTCTSDMDEYTLVFNKHKLNAHDDIYYAVNFGLTAIIAWSVLLLSLALRIILSIDFKQISYELKQKETIQKLRRLETVSETESDTEMTSVMV